MATTITSVEPGINQGAAMEELKATAKTDGALVDFNADDQKMLLILKNAVTNATHTAVIKAGDGLQGVSDLEVTLPPATDDHGVAVVIESGRFKITKGDDKGKVRIMSKETGTGTQVTVQAVRLP